MVKNEDVIEAFAQGKREGKTKHLFIEGNVLYSYGYHFPIAIRLWEVDTYKYIINSDRYSMTTSRHQNALIRAIGGKKNIIKEVPTDRMENYKKFTEVKEVMVEALDNN